MKLYQFYGEKASSRLQYECNDLANMISIHDRKSKVTPASNSALWAQL